jgi:hypothetical protein
MTDQLKRLKAALSDRYVIERELGAGELIWAENWFDELEGEGGEMSRPRMGARPRMGLRTPRLRRIPSGTDGVQELHLVVLLVIPIRARDTLCALY